MRLPHSFVADVSSDRPMLVTPDEARTVMDVYTAADLSAERHAPVSLPLARPNAPSSATI